MRIVLAGLLLAAASSASAAPAPPPAPPALPKIFLSPMGEPFRASTEGDDPVTDWFRGADRDGDGAISLAEMQADAARFFATLDRNHNGEIDPEEIGRYEHDVAPEIQLGGQLTPFRWGARRDRRDRDDERKAREDGLQGAGRLSWLNIPEPVAAADADLNRGVSRDEFARAAADRLGRLDSNQDGKLSRAELPRLPEQWTDEERKAAKKRLKDKKAADGIPIPID